MTTRSTINAIVGAFGSAIRAAGAVEANRAPKSRDLKTLGIDPTEFSKIGR